MADTSDHHSKNNKNSRAMTPPWLQGTRMGRASPSLLVPKGYNLILNHKPSDKLRLRAMLQNN